MSEPLPEPTDNDARVLHAAWLMWCFREGYTIAEDRSIITNWLLDDQATLTASDVALRADLIGMARELLDTLGLAAAEARADTAEATLARVEALCDVLGDECEAERCTEPDCPWLRLRAALAEEPS